MIINELIDYNGLGIALKISNLVENVGSSVMSRVWV
jgi:hypothetical protein